MVKTQRKFKGVWIPREIWLANDLNLIEKVLIVEIDSLDNESGCYASNRYFAEFFNTTERNIRRFVSSLNEKGWILIENPTSIKRTLHVNPDKTVLVTRTKLSDQPGQNRPSLISNTEDNNKVNNTACDVVNYFFELKGWANKDKQFYADRKIIYPRYLRSAKDLLDLCEGKLDDAKECLQKVSQWATSRQLDWSIETVFKKWYEIDVLKPKEKQPYYENCRIFQKSSGGKWYIIRGGEIRELGIPLRKEQIEWK